MADLNEKFPSDLDLNPVLLLQATTGYIIMDQAAEVAVSAEQPPLYDTLILPTIDLSAILDSSSSSNDDNRWNTNGGGGEGGELNTPTMDTEEEEEEVKDLPEHHFIPMDF